MGVSSVHLVFHLSDLLLVLQVLDILFLVLQRVGLAKLVIVVSEVINY